MITITFQGPQGPKTTEARSILAAIRAGTALETAGHESITITDREGDTMPLKWWQTVAAGVRVG